MNARLLFTAALAGVACQTAPVKEPALVVARLAADGVCQACPRDAADLPCGLDDLALLDAVGHPGCELVDACAFEAGWDRVLLVAVPGTADSFDGYLAAARSISVTTVLDDTKTDAPGVAGFARAEADAACSFVYAAAQRGLAADAEGTIRWIVADDEGDLDLYSRTHDVSPPAVCTTIAAPPGAVIAGVTWLTVTADVPANYPLERLQVAQVVNGVDHLVSAFTASEAVVTATGLRLTRNFVAPAQPYARFRVEVRGLGPSDIAAPTCGEPGAPAAEFTLAEPMPLRLALVDRDVADASIDFGLGVAVERIAGEPAAGCRELKLGVLAPDLPESSGLKLTTDVGSLANTGLTITRPLPMAGGRLVVPYNLPSDPPGAAEVHFSAEFGAATRGDLTLTFEPVRAVDWKPLSTTMPTVQVGATGSAAVNLKGRLIAPDGLPFAEDTRLDVRVEAVGGGAPAKCQPALPPEKLACDPSLQGDKGGCVLADTQVTVAVDGSFAVDLAPGACFIGKVTVTALGESYEPGQDPENCVGEWKLRAQEELSSIVLDFVDAP